MMNIQQVQKSSTLVVLQTEASPALEHKRTEEPGENPDHKLKPKPGKSGSVNLAVKVWRGAGVSLVIV